jgi:hypothetical protein
MAELKGRKRLFYLALRGTSKSVMKNEPQPPEKSEED